MDAVLTIYNDRVTESSESFTLTNASGTLDESHPPTSHESALDPEGSISIQHLAERSEG